MSLQPVSDCDNINGSKYSLMTSAYLVHLYDSIQLCSLDKKNHRTAAYGDKKVIALPCFVDLRSKVMDARTYVN